MNALRVWRLSWVTAVAWLAMAGLLCGAPPAGDSGTQTPADPEAVAFVHEILAQRPTRELSIAGVFHRRHSNGRRTQVPVRYTVRLGEPDWQSVYVSERTSTAGAEHLVVTHPPAGPNRYQWAQVSLDGTRTNVTVLSGAEAAVPFAGSDFWLSDLGMEFLRWPGQRQIRDAKITMRWGRPLKVIESINPRPSAGHYARVVSWMDAELGNLIRAEAHDQEGKRFKVFELKSFQKVGGRWQVRDMEIRNDQTDSRTRLEFTFQSD